jgi:hypothetical protein
MAKKTVPQHYWVAAQRLVDGKLQLTLLEQAEDGKGVAGCMAIIKSPEFASKYRSLGLPVRICIIRAEPALRLVARDNNLATAVKGIDGLETEIAEQVLSVLGANGVDVSGEVTLEEVQEGPSEAPGATLPNQDSGVGSVPGTPAGAMPAPPTVPSMGEASARADEVAQAAAAPAPTPPPVPQEFMDGQCIVPVGWKTLNSLASVQAIAAKIDPAVNESWQLAACQHVIQKYLATGILGGPDQSPPDASGGWVKEACPHCGMMTWKAASGDMRKDPVSGYQEHSCQGYLKARKEQVMEVPPVPVAPPAPAPQPTPQPAPLPEVPPATTLAPEPPTKNGQAPTTPPPATPPPPATGPAPPPPVPPAEQPPPPPMPPPVTPEAKVDPPPGFGNQFGAPPENPPPAEG